MHARQPPHGKETSQRSCCSRRVDPPAPHARFVHHAYTQHSISRKNNRGATAVQRRQPAKNLSTAWRLCRPGCPGVLSACLCGPERPPFLGGKRQLELCPQLSHRPVETAWGHPLISRFSRPFAFLQKGVEPGYEAGNPILVTRSPKRTSSRRTGHAPCFLPCVSAIVSLRSLLYYLFNQPVNPQ